LVAWADFGRSDELFGLDWLVGFIGAYAGWTAHANGAGCEPNAEFDDSLGEWNGIFYRLLGRTFARVTPDQAADLVARAIAVPDRSFFDIAADLVRAIDEMYFDGLGLDLNTTARLRGLIADRLVGSAGWLREHDRSELLVEVRIGPAIRALFFGNYNTFSGAPCYLLARGIEQVKPFLPQLTRLIEDGPVPYTALLTMNLLEVSHKPEHTSFFVSSALTWLRRQPSNTLLWVDRGLGARLAKWLELVISTDASLRSPAHPLRTRMDDMLARLVHVGVAEAYRVERALADG